MAEATQFMFSFKELAEMLVRKQGIREGHWGVLVKLGIAGANIPSGPDKNLVPAAIVPLLEFGIQKFEEANNLTVDAAELSKSGKLKKAPKEKRKPAGI